MTTDNGLKFKSMTIERSMYGTDKDKLKARVRCERWDTTLDLTMPDDIALEIMRLCSGAIAAQVNIALNDVARDHETWMLGQQVDAEAQAIEDGTGEGQPT